MRKLPFIIICCIGLITLLCIDEWDRVHWQKEKDTELKTTLQLCRVRLEKSFSTSFNRLQSLSALFIIHPDTTQASFNDYARQLLSLPPTMRALQFADHNTIVKYVYPGKTNEITVQKPMHLLDDPKRGPSVKKAIRNRLPVLQGPLELRQGGQGFIVRYPIFDDDSFIGLSIGVFDLNGLVSEALKGVELHNVAVALRDSFGKSLLLLGEPTIELQETTVWVADKYWTLSVGWQQPPCRPVWHRITIWLFGLGILLAVYYFFRLTSRHEQDLLAKVATRTSELEKANRSLRISDERFQLAMEFTHDGLYDWNRETNSIYYSPGWKRMLGYGDELPDKLSTWETLLHPEDSTSCWSMFSELVEKKRVFFYKEYRMRHKDGHWVDILSRANVFFDEAERGSRIIGTHVDISRQKQAMNHIHFLAELLESLGEAVIATDPSNTIIYWNTSAETYFGWEHGEIQGKNIQDIVIFANEDDVVRDNRKAMQEQRPWSGEVTICQKTGGTLPIFLSITPRHDSKGHFAGFISISVNISDKKQLETVLHESQRMQSLGVLAGGIAHDFNNILATVVGNTELAQEDVPSDSPITEYLEEISSATLRARDIVRKLLAFVGKAQGKTMPVLIRPLLLNLVDILEATMPANIELRHEFTSSRAVKANTKQLQQAVLNICTNSMQAMENSGGSITLQATDIIHDHTSPIDSQASLDCDHVQILISDTGQGIPFEIQDRVFEPYFTTKELSQAAGLGLSMARGIIEEYGGKFLLTSRPDVGTSITILLPTCPVGNRKMVMQPQQQPAGYHRILLVDDEQAIVTMSRKMLERNGYSVSAFTSSRQSLEAFRATPEAFDILITDMNMRELNGVELAGKLRAIRVDIPIILCTGYSDMIYSENTAELGVDVLLHKPVRKNELLKAVHQLLSEKKYPPPYYREE
ncbi:PAS domain-containing protein [Desulfopila sp. IMCC35008]|uniref:PAS domain-containing protein n=1 Tax=Desulfopila sp. IMCC35008 TaxID=2653858 RepID=UPI0013D70419|nr:PAS domain-containing protein [Desulfopila sp. IMCC35008]